MANPKNRQMIGDLLATNYEIIHPGPQLEELEENFSLLITDLPSWMQGEKVMKTRKEKEKPLFLPYLLAASPNDLKMVRKELWENFDEVINTPITKRLLMARLNVLLQTRQLSLQVNQLLHDKEMLIKEIHHRVKNNLMVISSLLNIQSRYIKDEESRGIFKESQNRARSMALIHERLYRSTDLKSIDFPEYIRSLTSDLFNTYVTERGRIQLEMDIDDLKVDVNNMVPLGLIINELVTNCLKYAFPDNKEGVIKISFHRDDLEMAGGISEDQKKGEDEGGDNVYLLEVSDNGVGLPKDLDVEKSDSLGMKLVTSLTQQLQGELVINSDHGTTFCIRFHGQEFE